MDSVTVQLFPARARIAPMKTITIPRLELMAAAISASLFSSVKQALKLPDTKTYLWIDSSTVLTVMVWVLRFQPKAEDLRKYTELKNEELLNAQKIIFRVVQKECYSNDETRKNLRGLQVFEDEEGILGLKSRLINEEESKYFISPIILPSKHLASSKTNGALRNRPTQWRMLNQRIPPTPTKGQSSALRPILPSPLRSQTKA
ncbi:hypothetical protein NPIL_196071 [Nephila pilipes]|uniref:Uncharacterized protein n=1 Tax=Nephila pilipes TaxID=299642 RepID=A0A8X6NHC2_NEPPI|nr:hypothetical protein NPIL_196071 [Nephila pilipes]